LRAEKNAKRFGEDAQDIQIAMAKLYLYNAVEIVIKNGKEGIISFAEGDEQRMMLMGLKRYTKYTNYPNVVALRNKISNKDAKVCMGSFRSVQTLKLNEI